MSEHEHFEETTAPAGGWGFACVSCSWAKPAKPHFIEACENRIKATAWEITTKRTPPDFFARHTLQELLRDFNNRMWTPGGFRRPLPAAERKWNTPNKKANFIGTRRVLLINPQDASRLGFKIGDHVTACTVADDGVARAVPGLRLTSYDIPSGCVAGYFPECNPLVPLWHHAEGSQVPAAKSIPIVLR